MLGHKILPLGFSSYEKSTIETFFRLAGRRAPHWALTTRPSEARVVLINATSEQDIGSLRSIVSSWQKVIIVGNSNFGTGWPVLPRPIKLTAILTLLDEVSSFKANDKPRHTPVLPAAVVIAQPTMTDVFAGITSQAAPVAAPKPAPIVVKPKLNEVSAQANAVQAKVNEVKHETVPLNEAPGFSAPSSVKNNSRLETIKQISSTMGRVLLVDDSEIALKYMQNRLRHFSYECELVQSGEEALAMVATNSYQFVFLDVMMAGLDGYQTCKAIKNNKARHGPAPVVVMLTSKGGTIDKIRGSMAGCDAYLTKPLNDKKLGAVLAKFDNSTVAQRWEVTNLREPLGVKHSLRNRSL